MSTKHEDLTGLGFSLLILAGVAFAIAASCGPNYLGWNHDAAERNARAWAIEVGITMDHAVCNESDTDGDGYVSCAFHSGQDVKTFECAGWTWIRPHSGCREPKIKIGSGR